MLISVSNSKIENICKKMVLAKFVRKLDIGLIQKPDTGYPAGDCTWLDNIFSEISNKFLKIAIGMHLILGLISACHAGYLSGYLIRLDTRYPV
jgi:hypothetical protein